jgi:hypothetical protein
MERMVTGDAKIDEIDMLYELSTQVTTRAPLKHHHHHHLS